MSRALIMCMTECAGCIRLQGEVNDLKARVENLEARVANLETELTRLKKIDAKMTVREICKTLERHICAEAVGKNEQGRKIFVDFFCFKALTSKKLKLFWEHWV